MCANVRILNQSGKSALHLRAEKRDVWRYMRIMIIDFKKISIQKIYMYEDEELKKR